MASGAYPVQLLHRPGGGGAAEDQWRNLGAAYAAGPDGQQPRRIVFVYPILPGDVFERLDGATLSWAEPEFALCFLDEAACGAVCGAIAPVVRTPSVDGIADILAGLRVAREEGAPVPGGADIAARLSIGRP